MATEKKTKIEKVPEAPLVNTSEEPTKFLVNHLILMRKFKISHELAINVMDIIHKLSIDDSWIDVKIDISRHLQNVIVYGRLLKDDKEKELNFFSAHLDASSGWIDKNSGEHLYVTHWMIGPNPPKKTEEVSQ